MSWLSRRRAVIAVPALASLAVLAWLASALFSDHRGTADFAPFTQCPLDNPATKLCLFTQTTGAELLVGHKALPINRTITLQGGVRVLQNKEKEIIKDTFIAAKNAQTLSNTPQPVPGGLTAVVDSSVLPPALRKGYRELIAQGRGEVTLTIELAEPASSIGIDVENLVEAKGTAVVLPVKVRLSNAFLGTHCYLGSSSHPILLRLTTGKTHPPKPNRPIEGKVGKAKVHDDYNLIVIGASSLVNNAFAAPAVTGCGTTTIAPLDRAIDSKLGLPAPAGHNTVILSGTVRQANAPAVRASK
jgi:hypothetical protein